MAAFSKGWEIQVRVITALMIRELSTRFGRENIGFLWIMIEPLLFAVLVAIGWFFLKGSQEHGIDIVAFVVTGYLPLTLFRHSVTRAVNAFVANGVLLYHRQVKILDFILVRFFIEMIGSMMAFLFIGVILISLKFAPMPADMGAFLAGWLLYCYFVFSLCLIIAPLSEVSEVMEKFIPVTTYIMIPFSGTFSLVSWLTPEVREFMLWSPPVNAMELMRYGIFGDAMTPYYNVTVPIVFSTICTMIGLILCRRVRRILVVE